MLYFKVISYTKEPASHRDIRTASTSHALHGTILVIIVAQNSQGLKVKYEMKVLTIQKYRVISAWRGNLAVHEANFLRTRILNLTSVPWNSTVNSQA